MGRKGYVSLLNINGSGSPVVLFSTAKGGETAGSVASYFNSSSRIAYLGGETAGSVASSSSGGSFSGCCSSFTAIA